MKIIVGLGNPGKQYQNTRHNAGYMVVEEIRNPKLEIRNNTKFSKSEIQNKFKAEVAEGEINGSPSSVTSANQSEKVLLVKPITFMNLSGEAVGEIYRFYKDRVSLEDIIVIHDDSDLELGRIKVQKGGASAGHHGIESIVNYLGSEEFNRVRVGIRTREGKAMEFVLSPFSKAERELFDEEIEKAAEAVIVVAIEGVEKAMNEYNTK